MKRLLIALLIGLPLATMAQDNTWEQAPATEKSKNVDEKYLEGAVPVVDGQVVFQTTIQAPGKSGRQIYDIMLSQLQELVEAPEQLEQSTIALQNPQTLQVVGSYQEWLVFKNKPLLLDRTRMLYHLFVDCRDGEATVQMSRIIYLYDEEREAQTYNANEWITDRYALNKKKTKLSRISGKFRRKTIDRKDYLFQKFTAALNP